MLPIGLISSGELTAQQSDPNLKSDDINAGVAGYAVEDSLKDLRVRVLKLCVERHRLKEKP